MTIDDDNTVYVGGLPFNATEGSLRRAFDLYGHIIAVKIVNDSGTRGKCYGFVRFTNPRSAIDAINDRSGRTVDGRVVRVNGVTNNRGGRTNFGRDRFQRNAERGKGRVRDYEHDRDRNRDRYSDRSRERSRSRDRNEDGERGYEHARDNDRGRDCSLDRDQERDRDLKDNGKEYSRNGVWDRERGYEHAHDHDRGRDRSLDRDQERDRDLKDNGKEYSRDSDWDWEMDQHLDRGRDRDMDGTGTGGHSQSVDKDKDQLLRKLNSAIINDRHNKECSSDSRDDSNDQVKEQVERSIQRREELKKEISQMEGRLIEKRQLVLDLQRNSKKLEDALISAKKLSSHRQMQLTKLCKCFLEVKEYTERVKSCEQELQSLVDTAMVECDMGDGAGLKDGVLSLLTNGNA